MATKGNGKSLTAVEKIKALREMKAQSLQRPDGVPEDDWTKASEEERKAYTELKPEEIADLFPQDDTDDTEADETVERARDISVTGSAIDHPVAVAARQFATHITKDFTAVLQEGVVAAEKAKGAGLRAMSILIRDFPPAVLDASPIPGTTKELIKLMFGDTDNAPMPAIFALPKKNKDGSMGEKKYDYYEIAYAETSEAQAELALVTKWEEQEQKDKDSPNKSVFAQAKARAARARYNNGVKYMRQAAAVWHKRKEVLTLPRVEAVVFVPDRDENGKEIPNSIMLTPKPIEIWDNGQRFKDDHVVISLETFLRYNVQWARDGKLVSDDKELHGKLLLDAEGDAFKPLGGVAALRRTVTRDSETGTAEVPTIKGPEIVEDFHSEEHAYFVEPDGSASTKRLATLRAALLNKNNRAYLVEYCQLMQAYDTIWQEVQTEERRYNQEVGDKLEAMKKAS